MQWILCAIPSERMCIDQIPLHKVCSANVVTTSLHVGAFTLFLFGFLTCKAGCGCGSACCGCGSIPG